MARTTSMEGSFERLVSDYMKSKLEEVLIKGKRHRNLKYIVVNGETYVQDNSMKTKNSRSTDAETTFTFKKVNLKDYEKTIDDLSEKISKKTKVKEIIRQALLDLPFTEIMAIRKEMSKKKPRVRNNKGCVTLTVGNTTIPIRD